MTVASSKRAGAAKNPERLLMPQEVADRLGVNRPVVDVLMDQGVLRSVNVARTGKRKFRRTTEGWLQEFLASRTAQP